MKKYLMTAAAALVLGGMMTSCTKDTDFSSAEATQSLTEKYEKVFVTAFGNPAEDQDWGFGPRSTATNGTRALTRGYTPSLDYWDFPEDADDDKFLADVPSSVNKGADFATGIGYVDNTVNKVNVWTGSADSKIYIKGNCDFTKEGYSFYIGPNTEVYLVEGATLTLTSNQAGNLQGNCKYYIAQNAKISTAGDLKLNNGMKIYNHGTIEANSISPNSNSVLYNVGTVTVTGKISVENELSVIVNNGTMSGGSLNTAGSGKFENNGTITIKGETLVNSNNNTWVNNGTYNTGSFKYHAASQEVINNCRLNVANRFTIRLADSEPGYGFKMDKDAGVSAREFSAEGPGRIYMGHNSVFNVSETAYMGITKDNYGIYGPESGNYAVFKANSIERGVYEKYTNTWMQVDDNQGFVANYFQNVYVITGSHFNFGYSDVSATDFANGVTGSQPYYKIADGAELFTDGVGPSTANTIDNTCTGESHGGGGGEDNSDPNVVRVIAEDLTWGSENGDFDFNDVVFDVKLTNNNTQVQITLKAAGGTLPLYVAKHEVHDEYGVSRTTMVNTGRGVSISRDPSFTIENTYNSTDVNVVAGAIPVEVQKLVNGTSSLVELFAPKGKAAAKVAVGNDYVWCDERESIDERYVDDGKGKFSLFVRKEKPYDGEDAWKTWYK